MAKVSGTSRAGEAGYPEAGKPQPSKELKTSSDHTMIVVKKMQMSRYTGAKFDASTNPAGDAAKETKVGENHIPRFKLY